MQRFWVPSAGRRFLRRLFFSLGQALIFGGVIGALVYFRAPEDTSDGVFSVMRTVRTQLERWELQTYDFRARALGRRDGRSDDVVVVAVDNETLLAGRQGDDPRFASQPWPRDALGGIVSELHREGATQVVLEPVFSDASPHACVVPTRGPNTPDVQSTGPGDDVALRHRLDGEGLRSTLAFEWETEVSPPPPAPLRPYLVFVRTVPTLEAGYPHLQRVLADRHPAYVLPAAKGSGFDLWAAVSDEGEGQALAASWKVEGGARVRELSAADRPHLFDAMDFFLALAEVRVQGLDPKGLPRFRALQIPVPALLSQKSRYGSREPLRDLDGRMRRIQHLATFEDRNGQLHVLPSLALAAAMVAAGNDTLRYANGTLNIGDGKFSIPLDASGQSLIRFGGDEVERFQAGPLRKALSAWRVVTNWQNRSVDIPPRHDNAMKGRIAVFTQEGASQEGETRLRTPVGSAHRASIFGQALVDILESRGIRRSRASTDGLLTFGMAFLGAFLALSFSATLRRKGGLAIYAASVGVTALGYVGFAFQAFIERGLWLAVFGPVLALGVSFVATTYYAVKDERRVRELIQGVLGRYVSADVARQVTRDVALVRPERRRMTVLFCELDGSTGAAESLPPETTVELLSQHLSEMTEVIRQSRGHLDKYLGDSLMAFWGAPMRQPRHAALACEAALRMRDRFSALRDTWKEKGLPPLRLRAGLGTGDVIVGNMGSDRRSNYTVMGKTVNFAARLEATNGRYGTVLLVSQDTAADAGADFIFRELDYIRTRKEEGMKAVFELCARQGELSPETMQQLATFAQALSLFRERRFAQALPLFEACAAALDDGPSHLYVKRCQRFVVAPPPEDWGGISDDRDNSAPAVQPSVGGSGSG